MNPLPAVPAWCAALGPQDFALRIRQETAQYADIIKRSQIELKE